MLNSKYQMNIDNSFNRVFLAKPFQINLFQNGFDLKIHLKHSQIKFFKLNFINFPHACYDLIIGIISYIYYDISINITRSMTTMQLIMFP